MSKKALITSRDPKGLQAISLFEAAYNKARLDNDHAQRLNERGGELQAGIAELIAKLSVSNRYANEEVLSRFDYPREYNGPKDLVKQIDLLAEYFGLSLGGTSEFIDKVLPTLTLPDGAEGWFAVPSVDALAKRYFPEVTDPTERYCLAVQLMLQTIKEKRKFYNWREGQIVPKHLRLSARTAHALSLISQQQPGDILIIPAQLGRRHHGRSVRRAREVFTSNEFGLNSLMAASIILTHPERMVRWRQLHMDCAGDEFNPEANDQNTHAPLIAFDGDGVRFVTGLVHIALELCGSASGFIPQS